MIEPTVEGLIFRPHTSEDLAFLLDSWGSSYFKGSGANKFISSDEFHSFHRPIRERFFAKPNACVIVCADQTDPWYILGWIAVEQIPSALILQYIYVRASMKKEGVASQLIKRALPTSPVFFTHLTEKASKIMSTKQDQFRGFKHCPHLV